MTQAQLDARLVSRAKVEGRIEGIHHRFPFAAPYKKSIERVWQAIQRAHDDLTVER